MRTPWASVGLFLLASFLGAAGQFLYKAGTDRAVASGRGLLGYVANARILAGTASYVLVMICFVAAFRKGGAPSVLYPVYTTTFLWAALIGWGVDGVPIRPLHGVGMFLIVVGIGLMGR
jgi:hypothetical protein